MGRQIDVFPGRPGGDEACRPRAMHISSAGRSAVLCVTEGSWIDLGAYKKIAVVRPSGGTIGRVAVIPNISKEQVGELSRRQSRLRVVLADDHAILRQGLRAILDAEPDLEVVGDASSIQDAVALSRCLQPDIVITDVSFANGSGIQAIGQLRRECVAVRVVMLTGRNNEECVRSAIAAGAHAYILKDSPVSALLRAIRSETPEYGLLTTPAHALQSQRRSTEPSANVHIAELTARERQVLLGVALGYSSKRIAGNLARSVKTIEKHRFKMMRKLGLHNAAAVTRFALDNGFLRSHHEPEEPRPENV
jgi:DNA-binding NarL/FixJ family response regulator